MLQVFQLGRYKPRNAVDEEFSALDFAGIEGLFLIARSSSQTLGSDIGHPDVQPAHQSVGQTVEEVGMRRSSGTKGLSSSSWQNAMAVAAQAFSALLNDGGLGL